MASMVKAELSRFQSRVGREIRELRKDARLSQLELSKRCSVALKTIQRLELGRQNASIEMLCRVLCALRTTTHEFFFAEPRCVGIRYDSWMPRRHAYENMRKSQGDREQQARSEFCRRAAKMLPDSVFRSIAVSAGMAEETIEAYLYRDFEERSVGVASDGSCFRPTKSACVLVGAGV